MAKDTVYPDAKLGWKPHPDSRSVIEELRHVTIGLEMTTAQAKGEKYDFGAKEKEFAARPQTRAAVVVGDGSGDRRVVCRARCARQQADAAVDWLARSPGRALRQAGDVVSRERDRSAYLSTEAVVIRPGPFFPDARP